MGNNKEKRSRTKAKKLPQPQQEEDRCLAEYKCQKCNRHWSSPQINKGYFVDPRSSRNTWPNKGQQCKKCHIIILPYNMVENEIPQQEEKRCFGEYKCPKCNRHWSSGNSWPNKGQQCKKCRKNILPYNMTPLKPRKNEDVEVNKKPHPCHLCQKCKELGYYCRMQEIRLNTYRF